MKPVNAARHATNPSAHPSSSPFFARRRSRNAADRIAAPVTKTVRKLARLKSLTVPSLLRSFFAERPEMAALVPFRVTDGHARSVVGKYMVGDHRRHHLHSPTVVTNAC